MFSNKPVIGILPTSNYLQTDDSFKDTYRYGNNYIKRIIENGGIPYLIPYVDDMIRENTLEMCDGLILPGGNRVVNTNFDVIDYFYKNNKPSVLVLPRDNKQISELTKSNKIDKRSQTNENKSRKETAGIR